MAGGISSTFSNGQHSPALGYVTAAIVRQNAHRELKPIIIPYGDD